MGQSLAWLSDTKIRETAQENCVSAPWAHPIATFVTFQRRCAIVRAFSPARKLRLATTTSNLYLQALSVQVDRMRDFRTKKDYGGSSLARPQDVAAHPYQLLADFRT